MDKQIERTLDFVEFLFDSRYLKIEEEPEQEKLVEAFIDFCEDNGCGDVDYDNAERKAFEVYLKKYRRGDESDGSVELKDQEAEGKALKIFIRKLELEQAN